MLLLALLAIVAAAARAHHTPGGRPGVHRPPSGVGSYLFSTGAVVMAAGCLFFLYLWFSERDLLVQQRQRRRGSAKALVFLLGIALIASILSHFHNLGLGRWRAKTQAPPKVHVGPHAKTKPKAIAPGQASPPEFKWLPVFVATAAGLVLLGAIGIRAMRRARLGLEEQHRLELELESLLDDTLADLYAMRDPREAIIAAYGRMERLFATSGLPRDPSEAPMEYLERALGEVRASGSALTRLTALFQWAKFSAHDVDIPMRDDAIRALTRVRDELKANRTEDEWRRAQAQEAQRERADDQSDRTYGENPFATVGDKVRGDPNTGGR